MKITMHRFEDENGNGPFYVDGEPLEAIKKICEDNNLIFERGFICDDIIREQVESGRFKITPDMFFGYYTPKGFEQYNSRELIRLLFQDFGFRWKEYEVELILQGNSMALFRKP